MKKHNGTQLYGIKRLVTDLKMGMNKELSSLSIKQKLAMKYVSKESKLTKIGNKIYSNTFTPYFPSIAYDFFESERYYGCGAGYNYMFIDSQGNVCPCDFTMLSFGNIHEGPIRKIWEETSKNFCKPGCSCYANLSNDFIFAKKSEEWPLKKQATLEILAECPSYDKNKSPEFYKRMGCPTNNVH